MIQVRRKAVLWPGPKETVQHIALEMRLSSSTIEDTIRQQDEGREIGPLDPKFWRHVAAKCRQAAEALEDLT